jgi:hypothetical protein
MDRRGRGGAGRHFRVLSVRQPATGKRKPNTSIVGKGGIAISGDVRANRASIVAGHNSRVNVSLESISLK